MYCSYVKYHDTWDFRSPIDVKNIT